MSSFHTRAADMSADPYDRRFHASKWTRAITVLDDHRLMRILPEFRDWTRDRHRLASLAYLQCARDTDRMYASAVDRALSAYGDHGSLVSGVVRAHFPDPVKDDLRTLARLATRYRDQSLAHWRAAGRSARTWRRL